MIPVTILTGFLGSGKTTLLARLLRTPSFTRTAVIINEFGEIGLDHELIEAGDESVIELSNGCLCCRVHSDLSRTLCGLRTRRDAGEIDFNRVVIETSGLADPTPILHAVATDTAVSEAFYVDRVVTTVDVVSGANVTEQYVEARRQIGLADLVLLTKTDIMEAGGTAAFENILDGLNHLAPRIDAREWDGSPGSSALSREWEGSGSLTAAKANESKADQKLSDHGRDFSTVCIVRNRPVSTTALLLFLEGMVAHEGPKLLRIKGIVSLLEAPDRPMVIHAVQHVIHQPTWLKRWPSDDRRTRIVMIGRNLSARWANLLLDTLEEEAVAVQYETRARRRLHLTDFQKA